VVSWVLSFSWVGWYGYSYNYPLFNSPGVNWLACLLWGVWLFSTIRAHHVLKRWIKRRLLTLMILWIGYFSFLLFFEYMGHYVLGIRLVTSEGPLVFGLIHGTPVLKWFYVTAGLFAIGIAEGIRCVLNTIGLHRCLIEDRVRLDALGKDR
jgi:hypothetical protein